MNFEGLEQFRSEYTQKTMESMMNIAIDANQKTEDRIAAAKVVDAMSDSIIKARLLSEQSQTVDDMSKDLRRQLRKLDD